MVEDVVCGWKVDEKQTKHKSTHLDDTYYFCSSGCKQEFDKKPERFVNKRI
ncbi:MAG TPA: YHS domain-containing protein [Candidatus Hodarchaeales archaeon]|nr:YHS domain-containing protein [Candidatus Hodarchaeales archaeon]